MSVRALFRILSVAHSWDGGILVSLAPTSQKRNGEECEENKRFWRWTPSGSGEIRIGKPERPELFERGALLGPGSYVYLDLFDVEEAPDAPENGLRVSCRVASFALDASAHGFRSRVESLSPDVDGNRALLGGAWGSFSIEMSITNEGVHDALALRLGPDGVEPRRKVVDITAG
jgi:hypothetical protein